VASAVLLTGTGKRYDIVASFAQHGPVVAVTRIPSRRAVRGDGAHERPAASSDPDYVPALQRLCERTTSARSSR
jgi:carbamoyl-phosphate synthase large subunit